MSQTQSFTVSAPTRADLAGGTLDLWPIYCLLGEGKTIPIALDLCASVQFQVSQDTKISFECVSNAETFSLTETLTADRLSKVSRSLQFPVRILSEFWKQHRSLPANRVRVEIQTKAPLKSGLGGSSTLCVALVKGLGHLFGEYSKPNWQWDLLKWVMDLEASHLRLPTGTQDYLAALFGGLHCFISRIGGIERVPYPAGVFEAISERMIVLFSGEMHDSGLSNWEVYKGVLEGNKEILRGFQLIQETADGIDKMLRSKLDWKILGQFLNTEWEVRSELFKVHTPRLTEMVAFLKKQKVYGVKVCGAAQGGSLVALVDPAEKAQLLKACNTHQIHVLPTSAQSEGVTIHS